MILNLDTLKYNLQLLQEVKLEFPILQDYEDDKVTRDTLNGVGLDQYVNLISYIKNLPNVGNQKLIYDDKITYRDVKKMVSELSYGGKAKNIFLKKTYGIIIVDKYDINFYKILFIKDFDGYMQIEQATHLR